MVYCLAETEGRTVVVDVVTLLLDSKRRFRILCTPEVLKGTWIEAKNHYFPPPAVPQRKGA